MIFHEVSPFCFDFTTGKEGINRYLGIRPAYAVAAALAGIDPLDSLEATLADSATCEAMAGNADAVAIMQEHYSSEMTTAIDTSWNDGLNLLNYRCGLKCYLLHGTDNFCAGITGGYTSTDAGRMYAWSYSSSPSASSLSKNLIDVSAYATMTATLYLNADRTNGNVNGNMSFGLDSDTDNNNYMDARFSYTISGGANPSTHYASVNISGLSGGYVKLYAFNRRQAGGSDYGAKAYAYNIALLP